MSTKKSNPSKGIVRLGPGKGKGHVGTERFPIVLSSDDESFPRCTKGDSELDDADSKTPLALAFPKEVESCKAKKEEEEMIEHHRKLFNSLVSRDPCLSYTHGNHTFMNSFVSEVESSVSENSTQHEIPDTNAAETTSNKEKGKK